ANSKTQFTVLGGLGLLAFAACSVGQIVGSRGAEDAYPVRRGLLALLLGLPLVFGWAVADLVTFGNPAYPVALDVVGHQLPGTLRASDYDDYGPDDLRSASNWDKWGLSTLEYRALSRRLGGYSLGQGDVSAGSESDRMGGSAIFLWAPAVVSLVVAVWRTG